MASASWSGMADGCQLREPVKEYDAPMIHLLPMSWSGRCGAWIFLTVSLLTARLACADEKLPLEAVTFQNEPGRLYLPVEEAARELRWKVERDEAGAVTTVNGTVVPPESLRRFTDGAELASTLDLQQWGAVVVPLEGGGATEVRRGSHRFTLAASVQRVEISLFKQRLFAWQGSRLVLQTRVSSGKRGSTPAGDFRAGPFRARMHYSSRYHHAPMPWSVQVNGHVFIHGFTSVPAYPASHGCIRVPLNEGNPARFFFEWVQTGTPVRIIR